MTLRLNSFLYVFGLFLPYDNLKGHNSFCLDGIWHIYTHICGHVYTQSLGQTIYLIHHTLKEHYASVWWQTEQHINEILPPSDSQRNCMKFSVTRQCKKATNLENCLFFLKNCTFYF